jgi:hypothetical protein
MVTKKDCVAVDYYRSYISLAKEEDVLKAISKNASRAEKFLKKIPRKKIDFAYAEGKWTIKEILQHIIDSERVFAYRSVSFARKDPAALPRFDEKVWAEQAKVGKRKWKDLREEFRTARQSTLELFRSFDDEQLLATGTASNNLINVVAIGFICAGHVAHHMRVMEEKYL